MTSERRRVLAGPVWRLVEERQARLGLTQDQVVAWLGNVAVREPRRLTMPTADAAEILRRLSAPALIPGHVEIVGECARRFSQWLRAAPGPQDPTPRYVALVRRMARLGWTDDEMGAELGIDPRQVERLVERYAIARHPDHTHVKAPANRPAETATRSCERAEPENRNGPGAEATGPHWDD